MKTTARELHTRFAPGEVWDLLMDPRRGPFWRVEWAGTVRYSLKLEQRAWRQPSAGSSGLVFEQTEADAPHRLVLRLSKPAAAVWTFEIAAQEAGTLLRFSAESEGGFSLSSLFGALSPEKAAERLFSELAAQLA